MLERHPWQTSMHPNSGTFERNVVSFPQYLNLEFLSATTDIRAHSHFLLPFPCYKDGSAMDRRLYKVQVEAKH